MSTKRVTAELESIAVAIFGVREEEADDGVDAIDKVSYAIALVVFGDGPNAGRLRDKFCGLCSDGPDNIVAERIQ